MTPGQTALQPDARPLIVVPTYDEAENIDALMEGIHEHARDAAVLFVDDNSPDGTVERIRSHQSRRPGQVHLIQRPRKLGLGTAYVTGFKWALEREFDPVLGMDADLSHDPACLPRLLQASAGHPVVIGSRYVPGGGTRNWSLPRRLISRFGNIYARSVLGVGVMDLTGGFNAWRREVLEAVGLDTLDSEGYSFQIELKYRAMRAGFAPFEVPIVFVDRRVGRSKMSWRVAREAMIRVWALRLRRTF